MSLGEITRDAVDAAMSQALEMGRKAFLESNGFKYATTYLLVQDGRLFDPKAIIGVAHGHVPGRERLQANEFDATAAIHRLRQLEYQVVDFSGLWWVNQGATYNEERAGGYVWAPLTNKVGQRSAAPRRSEPAPGWAEGRALCRRPDSSHQYGRTAARDPPEADGAGYCLGGNRLSMPGAVPRSGAPNCED